jgi:hypothetical protein
MNLVRLAGELPRLAVHATLPLVAHLGALRRADAVAEALALKRIATGEGGSDARWLLERRWPDRYAPARAVAAPKGAKPAEDQGTAQAPDNDALRRAELRRQGRPSLTAVKA